MPHNFIDITGQRFGRLVAVEYVGNKKWLFQCDCGNTKIICKKSVINGDTKSCGCLARELTAKRSASIYGNLREIAIKVGLKPATLYKRIQSGLSLSDACSKKVTHEIFEEVAGEEWRPVPNYEEFYEVSSLGRIRTKGRHVIRSNGNPTTFHPRYMTQHRTKKGYLAVSLAVNGKTHTLSVHRIVASAFHPCDNMNELEVNHIDENRANNRADNLEWLTHRDNVNYGTHNQRVKEWQERNGWHELRKRRVTLLVDGVEVATYSSLTDAANDTGVNISTICACCRGRKNPTRKGHLWRYAEEVNP